MTGHTFKAECFLEENPSKKLPFSRSSGPSGYRKFCLPPKSVSQNLGKKTHTKKKIHHFGGVFYCTL
jgi:hypothetical protein